MVECAKYKSLIALRKKVLLYNHEYLSRSIFPLLYQYSPPSLIIVAFEQSVCARIQYLSFKLLGCIPCNLLEKSSCSWRKELQLSELFKRLEPLIEVNVHLTAEHPGHWTEWEALNFIDASEHQFSWPFHSSRIGSTIRENIYEVSSQ